MIVMSQRMVQMREVSARNGMVAAKHPLAARAGVEVLQAGGNAVDAAVATAFVSGVVEPMMSGLGGGGWMTIVREDGMRTVVVYQVCAPLAAREDMYELTPDVRADAQGFVGVKDDANLVGHRAVGVPGLAAGLSMAAERYGSFGIDRLLRAAIAFAEDGVPVTWYTTLTLGNHLSLIRRFPETVRVFLDRGVPYSVTRERDSVFRQPDLAGTLRTIAADGPNGFYRGEVARQIVEDVQRGGGFMTEEDLATYEPFEVEPVSGSYRGYDLFGVPSPGSGPILFETLNMLEGFDLASTGRESSAALHLTIEAMRRSHADRFAYLADPRFEAIPQSGLISKAYAAERRSTIDSARTLPAEAGNPWEYDGPARPTCTPLATLELTDAGHTTSIMVVDGHGTSVAVTQTLASTFGSGVTVPGTGVVLNNSMTLFDPRPGTLNRIQPRKQPASSNAHTTVLKDGRFVAVLGAPGGRRILDTCTQVVLGLLEYGLGIQEAISAPLVDTSVPDTTQIDSRISEPTRARLRSMGHALAVREPDFMPHHFASPTGILRDAATGDLRGGADPYAQGVAAGY
jgi:gamma-glutamyltranspeptidase/glutathione hydrolase